ncbi:Tat pathway signal sequence domain protein [Roseateles sp.]|uniref:exo-rhamnogalacturonan lyase family protein n=1 Tax=Roseateles sp. TaxID=1971397 RepID=UPI0025E0F521|nr:Tat pathway signal sequence domain protein [Roseateles sp.]MBV8034608.1 Tat pathway signal sequence domain protein [Roseateles sp.]
MTDFSRRHFFKTATLPVGGLASLATTATMASTAAPAQAAAPAAVDPSALRWLDGAAPELMLGATLGLPWPRGEQPRGQDFHALDADGRPLPLQTWPLAYWPDGSLKWTAHALPAGVATGAAPRIRPGKGTAAAGARLSVKDLPDAVEVDTGVIRCRLPRQGAQLIQGIERDGRAVMGGCTLVAQTDDKPDAGQGPVTQTAFQSRIAKLTVEQAGPVRAVVKVDGQHRSAAGREWLPFSVRFYFYAGAESLRVMHSFVFDGDEHRDYLRGIGLRFDVPLRDALHDRHVRFAGEAGGLWAEGVRNLTGLRRDPGAAVREAQLAGRATPPLAQWGAQVRQLHHRIPAWGDYTLSQLSADGFQIKKRTQPGHGWIPAAFGKRAPGTGYVGGATGGVAFGLRDFWQRHPTQLDIRNAHTDAAQVTLWMHSPEAPAMDLRFYHDGLGMETHEQELEGLEMTYEDYEKGFGTPMGIARSSELTLWALAATPSRERLVQMAAAVQTPPQLAAAPQRYLQAGVFGRLWSLPDRSTPMRQKIEDRLDFLFGFYAKEVEQRHWYGFWDYGDIRHTYDADRHEWRYDVGGFAWDNSELSPDLWLWYAYLRSGRADIFRFAEAMVRHTSDVDIYHAGRFQGLGTRHNVQHWGCSAKQARISTSAYRRFYYYLTADERVGDVMREVLNADAKMDEVDPVRKIAGRVDKGPWPARIGFGTDWGSVVANVLTEWERSGDVRWRNKLLRGMKGIAAMPHGFFTGSGGYEPGGPNEGAFHNVSGDKVSASHLSAVFGAVEMLAELVDLIDMPEFRQAWLQYCALYNAPREQQVKALGMPHGGSPVLSVGHSRLTAYAAAQLRDPALAQRAWKEFLGDGRFGAKPLKTTRIAGPLALNPVDEAPWISTNDTAQWGLAAIQNLALVGEHLKD